MPDLYTLTAVWRKPAGELHTSTPRRDPRTLEEYVDALAKVASAWNLPPFAPPALPPPVQRWKPTHGLYTRTSPLSSGVP